MYSLTHPKIQPGQSCKASHIGFDCENPPKRRKLSPLLLEFHRIPLDLLYKIFPYLDLPSYSALAMCSRQIRFIALKPSLLAEYFVAHFKQALAPQCSSKSFQALERLFHISHSKGLQEVIPQVQSLPSLAPSVLQGLDFLAKNDPLLESFIDTLFAHLSNADTKHLISSQGLAFALKYIKAPLELSFLEEGSDEVLFCSLQAHLYEMPMEFDGTLSQVQFLAALASSTIHMQDNEECFTLLGNILLKAAQIVDDFPLRAMLVGAVAEGLRTCASEKESADLIKGISGHLRTLYAPLALAEVTKPLALLFASFPDNPNKMRAWSALINKASQIPTTAALPEKGECFFAIALGLAMQEDKTLRSSFEPSLHEPRVRESFICALRSASPSMPLGPDTEYLWQLAFAFAEDQTPRKNIAARAIDDLFFVLLAQAHTTRLEPYWQRFKALIAQNIKDIDAVTTLTTLTPVLASRSPSYSVQQAWSILLELTQSIPTPEARQKILTTLQPLAFEHPQSGSLQQLIERLRNSK